MITEEKLELAKDLYQSANAEQKYVIEKLFPELRDGEDEMIRKWLIELVEEVRKANPTNADHNGMCSEAIAWLENQGEKKPVDKVEPKFKAGDWIIKNDGRDCFSDGSYVLQIKSIDDIKYKLSNHCYLIEPFANTYRLWTIQDAKVGDVIFSNDGHGNDSIELIKSISDKRIEFWFCLSSNNNFKDCYFEVFDGIIPYTNFASKKGAIPATKEQRDLLFQKIKEEGYEWDGETKELKKDEIKIKAGRNYRCTKTHIYAGLDWFEGTKYYADEDYSLVNNGCTCFCPKYSKYEHNNLFEEVEYDGCVEKQGKQKIYIEMKTPEESLGVDSDTYNKIVDECVYGEQKSAWSEEGLDETKQECGSIDVSSSIKTTRIKTLENILSYFKYDRKTTKEEINASFIPCLENLLKDVENTNDHADWSKEDEEMLDAIIADIKFTQKAHIHDVNQVVYEREIDWLKSLRP